MADVLRPGSLTMADVLRPGSQTMADVLRPGSQTMADVLRPGSHKGQGNIPGSVANDCVLLAVVSHWTQTLHWGSIARQRVMLQRSKNK